MSDRIAVCKTCGRVFEVTRKLTITFDGRIMASGHYKPSGELCLDNSAQIPDYVEDYRDYRVIGTTPYQPG